MKRPVTRTRDFLPYGTMFDDSGILLLHRPCTFGPLARFALGGLWEVTPLDIDLMSESEIERAADDVKALLLNLSTGSTLDVRLDIRPITRILKWEALHAGQDDPDIQLMRAHIANGMPHRPGASCMRLTECRVTVGFRAPVRPETRAVRDVLEVLAHIKPWGQRQAEQHLLARLSTAFGEQLAAFQSEVTGIERALSLLELSPKRLLGADAVSALNRAASPEATEAAVYEPGVEMAEHVQLPRSLDDHELRTDRYTATLYTLERSVAETFAGILGSTRTPEVKVHGLPLAELGVPLSIVVTIMAGDQARKKVSLSLKHAFASLQTQGGLGERRPETAKQTDALGDLIAEMSDGSEHVLDTMVSAILWHESGEPPADAVFQKMSLDMGVQWYRERFITSTLFLRSLPLGCDPGFPQEAFVRRSRQIITRTLARLVPLWGSFRGSRTPTALYVNRRGEPVFFDLFDRASSPHVTIVGKTRRGKSSFLNTYISQVSGEYLTYILDRYGSYDELSRRQHGTLVKFNPAEPVCIGPMDGPLDSRHRQHMAMVIEEMSMAGFRDQHVTPDERTLIGNLLEDWALKGPLALTMTDFVRYLGSLDDPFSKRLALLLGPYVGSGRYAPFIDGPNQLGIGDTRLWVADIAGLEDFPDLQSIIIASLFTSLERHLTNPELIGTRKILAADEVSFLIRNPQAAEFLRKLAIALARFFASFVLISQSMSDFLTDLGSAAVKMSDTHIFFNLGRQELHEISDVFKLSEHTADTIVNLRKYDDCSEAVIRFEEGEGGAGVIRVVPPPEFITAIGQSEAHRRARGE
jgi:hypothetical protein